MGITERKEREKERRKQQIIVSAKRVFSNKGFIRSTMEDIASEAELSPGTLYLYFKNKEELFTSLSLRILQYMIIRLEEICAESKSSPVEKLDAMESAMFDVYDFDPASIIHMLHIQSSETLKDLSPQVLSEFASLSKTAMNLLANIFSDGIQKKLFVDDPPIRLADAFWSLYSGVILWQTDRSTLEINDGSLKEALSFAFRLFNRSILLSDRK
jgi:AcrR family transcriptional regulator